MSTTANDRAKDIEHTRGFIRRILTGEISPETRPTLWMEGDDVIIHALFFLELKDRAWLEAQLADEAYSQAAKDLVRSCRPQISTTK